MAQKTVLCHFYNEEWILPFWLKHHREIFDHGIMIDYNSTDRSVEIIREYCPNWQIVTSKNKDFSPGPVDTEVEEHEHNLTGWRICLNATEFMVGNYHHLDDRLNSAQAFLGQWMFVDMERRDEPYYLDVSRPIWEQRWHGYGIVKDFSANQSYGSVPRAPRSIHNYAFKYPSLGRHYPSESPTYNDLTIFYMGYASLEEGSIKRKMQIQTQCPNSGHGTNHQFNLTQLLDRFRKEQQPLSRNIKNEIQGYIDAHVTYIKNKQTADKIKSREDIQAALNSLQTALQNLQ